jgi:hypothetical protein
MRYIIISPNAINDSYVKQIGDLRTEFMQNARVTTDAGESVPMEVVQLTDGDYDEKKTLNGSWASMQEFNEKVLPDLNLYLKLQIRHKTQDIVHVDLGKSLITLYMAYFAINAGISTNISWHMPDPKDEKPTFNIGGESAYSNPRNNLRRYLASQIMQKSMNVFIDSPTIVDVLNRLFPRIDRELHIDPLIEIRESEEEIENVTP